MPVVPCLYIAGHGHRRGRPGDLRRVESQRGTKIRRPVLIEQVPGGTDLLRSLRRWPGRSRHEGGQSRLRFPNRGGTRQRAGDHLHGTAFRHRQTGCNSQQPGNHRGPVLRRRGCRGDDSPHPRREPAEQSRLPHHERNASRAGGHPTARGGPCHTGPTRGVPIHGGAGVHRTPHRRVPEELPPQCAHMGRKLRNGLLVRCDERVARLAGSPLAVTADRPRPHSP